MKKIKRKALRLALCGVLAAGITVGAFLAFGEKDAESATVSAGLQHFADNAYFACSAPAGQTVTFTPEWFDQTLQGGSISAITVTALPPVTEGTLELGHTEVTLGQRILRENLSYLTFIPRENVKSSSFEFVPATNSGECGYSLLCNLSLTEAVNCCPAGTKTVTAVSTHAALSLHGALTAEDPEGEALCFEPVQYPKNGTLLLNASTGAFTYAPRDGFVGEDSFTWRVQDTHGAFSETATVSITDTAEHKIFHLKLTYPSIRNGRGIVEDHAYLRHATASVRGEYKVYALPECREILSEVKDGRTHFALDDVTGYAAYMLK